MRRLKISTSSELLIKRLQQPTPRAAVEQPLGSRVTYRPRQMKAVHDGEAGEIESWVVIATKQRPWTKRNRNRAANKRARAARRANRG